MRNNRISKKSRKFNQLGIVSANLLSGDSIVQSIGVKQYMYYEKVTDYLSS